MFKMYPLQIEFDNRKPLYNYGQIHEKNQINL